MKRKKLAERTLIKYPFRGVPTDYKGRVSHVFLVAGEPYATYVEEIKDFE